MNDRRRSWGLISQVAAMMLASDRIPKAPDAERAKRAVDAAKALETEIDAQQAAEFEELKKAQQAAEMGAEAQRTLERNAAEAALADTLEKTAIATDTTPPATTEGDSTSAQTPAAKGAKAPKAAKVADEPAGA